MKINGLLIMVFVAQNLLSQTFELPDIPKYDSIFVDSYEDKIKEKTYFLEGERVFEIGYNTGSVFYTPFAHIGGGKEDSCYAYFNGSHHDQYDFYYISENYIINRRYSEDSKIFRYKKFDWNNIPIENGDYYFIKEMYGSTISHYGKYKIGEWVKYDSIGTPIETINYDNSTLNGKSIKFIGSLELVDSLKLLADRKIIETYGKGFFKRYVRFNLDQSGYYPFEKPRPDQPRGYSLLKQSDREIYFVDLSYDIILGDERFNVIHFRVSKEGKFLGRTHFPRYTPKYFYLTQGLDNSNKGKFHKNIKKWKKIASNNGLDITSKDFNVSFDFKLTNDYYGELRMVLEQIVGTRTTNYSFYNKIRQIIINPWTGEIKTSTNEEGISTIIYD